MKHWDGRDLPEAKPLPLTKAERARLRALFEPPPHRRAPPTHAGSKLGLALAFGVLIGLAWLLSPSDPVSSQLVN